MRAITRNGICLRLEVSPYTAVVNGVQYFFSSKLHLDKFLSERLDFRDSIEESLGKRFKIHCSLDELADFLFYRKVETRGFRMVLDGRVIEWPEYLKFSGTLTNGNGSKEKLNDLMRRLQEKPESPQS